MSGRSSSYTIAMEEEMASFYSNINGMPSVTNRQSVVINEGNNIILTDTNQQKCTDRISVRSPVIVEADESTQDITDTRTVRKTPKRRKSIASYSEINLRPSKLVLIIGICCIIGLALPPIILHFIQIDSHSHDDLYTSDNFSVIAATCNISTLSDPTLVFTYEALRATSQLTSQYCITKLSEALTQSETCEQFNNLSYIMDIMCQQVRQNYCTSQWRSLEFNSTISEMLIDCNDDTGTIDCGEQFGLAYNDSICLPLCSEFSQYSDTITAAFFAISIFSHVTNIIGGMAVLIMVLRKRQKMFRFPQVLIVINVIIMTIVALFLLISLVGLDSWSPLCSSEYLSDNSPTTFCQLQGFVWTSGIVLYGFFWVLYILHLALKLLYPLRSVKIDRSDYSRRIHIMEILIIFVIGTTPYIVFASNSQYEVIIFPPFFCGYNTTYLFYGTVLPTLTIGCTGLTLMLLVLYKLHIHEGIFKRRSAGKSIHACHFTTPEVKVFIGFFYLLAVLVSQWAVSTVKHITLDTFRDHLEVYVRCMSTGNNNPDCAVFKTQMEAHTYPGFDIVYFILIGFLNFSNVPFVVQFKTVKHTVRRATMRMSLSSEPKNRV